MLLNILYLSKDDVTVFEFLGYSLESSLDDGTVNSFIADNEKEAIDILEFNNINLIVADMNIDSICSFEFYDKLHLDMKFQDIPFVFLSSNEEDQEISILKGLSNFFLKPLDVDQLLKTLHCILYNTKSNNSQALNYSVEYEEDSEQTKLLEEILEFTTIIDNKVEQKDIESIKEVSKKIKDNINTILSTNSEYSNFI